MKKVMILMIALLMTGFQLMAQDVVYFKNGNQQKGKVLEISANEVVYKKAENPDGPAYTSNKSDVQMIEFSNGYKEVFAQSNNNSNNNNNNSGYNQSNNNNNQQAQNGNGGGNTYQNNNYYPPARPNVNVNINPIWGGGGYYGGGWGWGGPAYYGGGYYGGGWGWGGWGGRGYYGGGWGGGYHHHHHH